MTNNVDETVTERTETAIEGPADLMRLAIRKGRAKGMTGTGHEVAAEVLARMVWEIMFENEELAKSYSPGFRRDALREKVADREAA